MTTLRAYLHKVEKTGNLHVRVQQPMPLGDAFAADMHKCGSPAHWEYSRMEWDYPLTAACVLALQRVAERYHVAIYWSPELQQFADEQRKVDDYEQSIRMSLANIIKRNDPLPGYVTNTYNGTMMPLRHQVIAYHWGLRFTGLLLAHDPGCIAGSEEIKVMRHGKVGAFKLATLYAKFNKIDHAHPWKKEGVTTTKSLMPDGVLRHNEIKQILHKGRQPTIKVMLASGKTLICTLDHEIATPGGWVSAEKLRPGDVVLTNGIPVCPECGTTKHRIITYKYSKYRGICLGCAHRGKRNGRFVTGRMFDKDGYVLVSGHQNHPHADKDGCVREHVLVMEKKLGRFLTDDERVHHKDEVKDNNAPDNLELTTDSKHARLHAIEAKYRHMDGGRAGTGGEIIFIPREDTVVSLELDREQDVYDIVMADPGRNFVANGVIVHNCGKSRSAVDLARGWYDIGAVRAMQQVWVPEANRWGVRGGILVVTKAAMVRTWAKEFMQWQNMTAMEVSGDKEAKFRKSALPAHAHVVNYESLHCVLHSQYDAIVADESHALANSSAQTANVLQLAQHARRRLALTGTPISNSLESSFFQMLFVDGGRALGPSKTKFLEEYFTSERQGPQGAPKNFPKQGALEAVSEKMARCTYFLKKEEALDLPVKTHTPIYLEMATDQARYYNTLKDDYLVYIQDSQVSVQQAASRMMKLRQIAQGFVLDDQGQPKDFSSAKVDTLIDMLKTKLHGRKVVVWAVFTHEIDLLCRRMMAEQIGFVRLDGTVTSKKIRDQGLELWNTNPAVSVFIGQIQMGVGITLHANECTVPCYDCIYLGIDYSFINWTQSQDRIHRIGQKYPCSYTYLLTVDGVDRNIYQSLQAKARTSNAVYKVGKEFYASLVKGDEPNLAAIDTAAA